ncbi:hypothetical protein NQ318_001883 [Aromia moschata]|uniref:Uncharacterized protein n=1 Tax=Aromia moschata TaxID=1265417 RepID=A0AAV8Z1F1_9CUCU|nr:hypothetical protein NQ318_001883 [Aromia moschata]
MAKNEERLCRLCLKASDDFEAIGEIFREIFDVLLLNINVSLISEPVMCSNCTDSVYRLFDFKATCLYAEDCIVPFIDTMDDTKVDLLNLICSDENQEAGSLSVSGGITKDLITKCLPEVDLNIFKEPMLCKACLESLNEYYNFMANCHDVEERINNYGRSKKDNGRRIKVDDVRSFSAQSVPDYIKKYHSGSKKNQRRGKNIRDKIRLKNDKNKEGLINKEQQQDGSACDDSPQEIQYELSQNSNGEKMYKCNKCIYITMKGHHIRRHQLTHLDVSQRQIYKCPLCSLQMCRKYSMKRHMMTHELSRKIYKCDLCEFTTRNKCSLKGHMLRHTDATQTEHFKCDKCPFVTLRKTSIRKHVTVHMEAPKLPYQCYICTFGCHVKSMLQRHLLRHSTDVFKCDLCAFETNREVNLKQHKTRIHTKSNAKAKAKAKVKKFECSLCDYKGLEKRYLDRHMNRHKSEEEKKIYVCAICSLQLGSKYYLRDHIQRKHAGASRST